MLTALQRQGLAAAARRAATPAPSGGGKLFAALWASPRSRMVGSLACQQPPIFEHNNEHHSLAFAHQYSGYRAGNSTHTLHHYPHCARPFALQIRGGKKGAKLGNRFKDLDERAHREEHEKGKERREKKKEKTAARKGKGKKGGAAEEAQEPAASGGGAAPPPKIELDDSWEAELREHEEEDKLEEEEEEEDPLPNPDRVEERMQEVVKIFENNLKKIRGAEPTPELFEDVVVDAYGENTNIKTVAQVEISSPTLAYATCYDPSLAKNVDNAIRNRLMLNPSIEEGGVVKIPLPRISMETRVEATKGLKKRTEAFKVRLRDIRHKAMDVAKKGVAGKLEHVSKDEAFRVSQEIEKVTDKEIRKLEELAQAKHDAIMKV